MGFAHRGSAPDPGVYRFCFPKQATGVGGYSISSPPIHLLRKTPPSAQVALQHCLILMTGKSNSSVACRFCLCQCPTRAETVSNLGGKGVKFQRSRCQALSGLGVKPKRNIRNEAMSYGHGGISLVSRISGIYRTTIIKAVGMAAAFRVKERL